MRRLLVLPLFVLGCRSPSPPSPTPPPPGVKLATRFDVADPVGQKQLKGFYLVEEGKWRWTEPAFSVRLGAPRVVLRFRFSLPEAAMAQMKRVTLNAKVNGVALAPETYDRAGDYTYTRPVDPALLGGGPADVQFGLDNQFKPGGGDTRTLGVIARTVGFETE